MTPNDSEPYHSNSYPPIEGDTGNNNNNTDMAANETRPRPAKMWPQYLAAIVTSLGAFIMGTCIGWSGPALKYLQDNSTQHEFPVTDTDANWIGSLMPAGALLGSLIGGTLANRFGRKGGMYFASLHYVIGYVLIVCANHVAFLYAGRFVTGIGAGLITTSGPTYIAEIASPQVRGLLGSGFQVFVTLGILWVAVWGAFLSWRWLSVTCIFVIVLWAVLMLPLPRSPTYLLTQREFDQARECLQQLRGSVYVEAELAEVQEAVEEAAFKSANIRDLGNRENLQPLLISLFLMFGQQFCGVNAVLFYSVSIFEAAKTPLNNFVENIILAIVQVVATIASAFVIDKLGRKVLLIASAIIMCITINGLGAYFYVQNVDPSEAAKISFLPVSCLCLYLIAFSIAFGAIPWLMMAELMSPEMKSLSTTIASGSNWMMGFLVTRFYGDAVSAVGKAPTFWGFGGFILITLVGVITFVPETKGRSLEQIQQLFRTRRVEIDEEPILDDQSVGGPGYPEAAHEDDSDNQIQSAHA